MNQKPFESHLISKDTSIRDTMQILNSAKRVLFVVEDGKLVGSVTDGDIRRWILASGNLNEPIEKTMFSEPYTITKDQVWSAQSVIIKYQVLAVPIVDENKNVLDIIFWDGIKHKQKNQINAPVIIMAGGKGERLMPYTTIVPKPLLPIGDTPIAELIIDSFKQYGCNEFFLTINYKKNMIKAYFDDIEKDYEVSFIEEDIPLGTGGGLYFLKKLIKDTFFVSNCDILLDADYADIYDFHKEHKNVITVVTSLKNYILPYGVINLNESGYVESITEKPSSDHLVNTGVYVVEPEAFDFLKENKFMHITDLIEKCINTNKQIGTYPISEDAWMDMGQFEDMEKMKERLGK